ncbi:hypothetical protein AN958_10583 [Leucoagaricus sp. SymC.cos]|nr:hypothetical protein AN958_10583 [Leucoagaricus sp. SymC.cos]
MDKTYLRVLLAPNRYQSWSMVLGIHSSYVLVVFAEEILRKRDSLKTVAIGLTVGQSIAVCVLSNMILSRILRIALAMFVSGMAGSKWHVPFAVINRTCWGIRGAWFVVMNRIILSCCWFGIEGWYGGQMVRIMIGAIWPSFHHMKNRLPASVATTSNELLSFMIFWLIGLPLILLRPERYDRPALFASAIVTVAMFIIFIWAVVKQGNAGPLWNSPDQASNVQLSGSQVNWIMLWMITRGIGWWASGILYQSDFTRYAKQNNNQFIGQILVFPLVSSCTNIFGIITTSCARGFYPEEPLLWKLYDLLYAIQMHEGKWARVAVFFGAFAFLLSTLSATVMLDRFLSLSTSSDKCNQIAATAIVGGIDFSALLPRYINIRRGAYIIACTGVLIQPWRILNTANSFIAALTGYAVFLSPLTGIMLAEYHIVRQRRIKLSHIFTPNATSDYWFWRGLNPRAPVAFILGVLPSLPGFASSINPQGVSVSTDWMRIYYMSWFLGVSISGFVWIFLNKAWPPRGLGETDQTETPGSSSDHDTAESFSQPEEKAIP